MDNTELEACEGCFTRTHGVPCSHKCKELLLNNKLLQPADFHSHWLIDGSSAASAGESALPPRQKLAKTATKKRKADVAAAAAAAKKGSSKKNSAVTIRHKTANGRLFKGLDLLNQTNKVTENDT